MSATRIALRSLDLEVFADQPIVSGPQHHLRSLLSSCVFIIVRRMGPGRVQTITVPSQSLRQHTAPLRSPYTVTRVSSAAPMLHPGMVWWGRFLSRPSLVSRAWSLVSVHEQRCLAALPAPFPILIGRFTVLMP